MASERSESEDDRCNQRFSFSGTGSFTISNLKSALETDFDLLKVGFKIRIKIENAKRRGKRMGVF